MPQLKVSSAQMVADARARITEIATPDAIAMLDDPDVVFVHLDQCDGAGHTHGYAADEAEYVVATTDGSLGHRGEVTALLPEYEAWADQCFAAGSTP